MNRFEMTVVSSIISNIETQLQSLRTIIAASLDDRATPAKPKNGNMTFQDHDYTTDEDDRLIEEALAKQVKDESDTLGEIFSQAHGEIYDDGNAGRREG